MVTQNLILVFPDKSIREINQIRKQFYRHLCDMFLEMVKTLTVSKKEMDKRFVLLNPDELDRIHRLDKSFVVMMGHFASYEWSIILQYYMKYDGYAIYKKIKNKYFDNLIKRIRSKHNLNLVSTKEAIPKMSDLYRQNQRFVMGFIADQSPKLTEKTVWLDFLGQKTPTFVGAERISKKLDLVVAYLKVNKVKRGHYEAEFVTLADEPRQYEDFEITEKFNSILEKQIRANPQFYLWTHKRWKHKFQEKETTIQK